MPPKKAVTKKEDKVGYIRVVYVFFIRLRRILVELQRPNAALKSK